MDTPTDESLLEASEHDRSAFGSFYRRFAPAILGYFVNRTLDPHSAADLTAETFAQAFASRSRFRNRGSGSAAAWLYTIASRQHARFLRKGRVEDRIRRRIGLPTRELSSPDYERIEELIDFEKVGRAVRDALMELTAEQREAVSLRVIDGRSYSELAQLMKCSEETARARVSRGLRRLAAAFES
jgi:RNA polymerase sigma-70 factor (ECF subfamily)